MTTPSAPPSGTSTSAVTENDLFLMLTTLFSDSRPMPGKSSWELPWMSVGRPASSGFSRSAVRSSIGQHVVLDRLDEPQPLQLVQLLGVLGREVRAPG